MAEYCSEAVSYGEDQQLTLGCVLESNKICILDEYKYYYRNNPTSIVNTYKKGLWDKIKILMDVILKIPRVTTIRNYEQQYATLFLLYANDCVKQELLHRKDGYREVVKNIIQDATKMIDCDKILTENMGRFDILMSKAIMSHSFCVTKLAFGIYSCFCKLTHQLI